MNCRWQPFSVFVVHEYCALDTCDVLVPVSNESQPADVVVDQIDYEHMYIYILEAMVLFIKNDSLC